MPSSVKWDPAIFQRNHVVASPSQIADYLRCIRYWWFSRVIRLPQRLKEKNEWSKRIGEIAHECLERYLNADAREKLDLFPEGWSAELSIQDAELVQRLVKAGIDSGCVRRYPNMRIEHGYARQVLDKAAIIGVMDVLHDWGVDDHKTPNVGKHPWIPTEQELANDPKMLCYAAEWLHMRMLDRDHPLEGEMPEAVTLRLNNLCKDGKIIPREVQVSVADVHRFYQTHIVPAVQGMLDLKRGKWPVDNWRHVIGPCQEGACDAFGGCTYATICTGCETPEGYVARTKRMNQRLLAKKEQSTMGIFDLDRDETPAPPASGAATQQAPASTVEGAPPWHYSGCMACKASPGWNSKGRPCTACDMHQKTQDGPRLTDFVIDNDAKTWTPKGDAPAPAVEAKKEKPAPASKPVTTAPPPEQPTTAAASDGEPTGKEAQAESKPAEKKTTRKRKTTKKPALDGFILVINGAPVKADGMEVVSFSELFAHEAAELANDKKADSYYALPPFDRRDWLGQHAAAVAGELSGKLVFATTRSTDEREYLDKLRPFASIVIEGVG